MLQPNMLINSEKVNEIKPPKHVDNNATINQSLISHVCLINTLPKKNVTKKSKFHFKQQTFKMHSTFTTKTKNTNNCFKK